MTKKAKSLADQLLDAQVEFVLAELTGDRLAEVITRDVDDVLAIAATMTVGKIVDADEVKEVGRKLIDRIGSSPLVTELVTGLPGALYDLAASDDQLLGEVVDRDLVAALIAKVLSMDTLHDRAIDRVTESPLVATVAARFATKIVGEFVQQNRARAERVPGVGSLLSIGTSAANRVKSASNLDQLLGVAAGKGKQFAVKATSNATRELIRDASLQAAAMELWDLHAEETISELREYLSQQDLRELALLVHDIVVSARNHDYAGHLLDACVDVFFEIYGSRDVASLLTELGIDRDDLIEDLLRFAPPIIEAAKKKGVLAKHVRRRLAPFFHSDEVAALLAAG